MADHVDHIIPIEVAPDKMMDATNLQTLCKHCHRAKTHRERRGLYADFRQRVFLESNNV